MDGATCFSDWPQVLESPEVVSKRSKAVEVTRATCFLALDDPQV